MKVKRYVGESAQEAMQKVRSDLGRDAIILNTRKIRRKGLAGIFSKPLIEVVATIDNDISSKQTKQSPPAQARPAFQGNEANYDAPSFMNELNANLKQNLQAISNNQYKSASFNAAADEKIEFNIQQPLNKAASVTKDHTEKEAEEDFSTNEINNIKSMLSKVYDAVKTDYEGSRLSEVTKALLARLEKNEVDKVIINDLKEDIIEKHRGTTG